MGNGAPWDLDRSRGGLSVLPPYQDNAHSDWYKGTANAIYQNINFIKKYNPEYVLILSGDHIYKMNYADMLSSHKRNNAVCTVATVTVPKEEASRFGICNTSPDGSICEFEEKPKRPKNNQASMGIYIFNTKTLIEYLEKDEEDVTSANDFGKNIIPALLKNKEAVFAYKFRGYWKDVGTIKSLWEANMDLLGDRNLLNFSDRDFRIYSRNMARPPLFIGENAKIVSSMISEGGRINGTVFNSVLSGGVTVEEDAEIYNSVIMSDVTVKKGAKIYYAVIDSDSCVGCNCIVGDKNADKNSIVVLPKDSNIEGAV